MLHVVASPIRRIESASSGNESTVDELLLQVCAELDLGT